MRLPIASPVPLLAVLLSFFACGGPAPAAHDPVVFNPCGAVSVAPDPNATLAQSGGVSSGMALWNALGFTKLSLADGSNSRSVAVLFEPGAAMFNGYYDDSTGEVLINTRLTDDGRRSITVAHELGHAMGLPHVPVSERVSVMNPDNLTITPTAEDLQTLQARWSFCATP